MPQADLSISATDDLPVAEFLRRCAQATHGVPGAAHAFLAGGLAAVRAATEGEVWRQVELRVAGTPRAEFYRALDGTLRVAFADRIADDGFFVHKSPGLRLRLRTDLARAAELDLLLTDTLEGFTRRQLIEGWYPSVYEPERTLFGGPVSMRSVHRVFTAGSLAWTGFHGLAAPAGPIWAMSLLMLGSLLSALDVVGWEDRNVWDHLRVNAGRVASDRARRAAAMSRLAAVLRHHWDNPDATRARLSEPAQALAEEYAQALRAESPRWIGEYFRAPGAWLGPRAVAAHTIVFHWNRAALPAHHQALLVAALAVPPGHDSITGGQS